MNKQSVMVIYNMFPRARKLLDYLIALVMYQLIIQLVQNIGYKEMGCTVEARGRFQDDDSMNNVRYLNRPVPFLSVSLNYDKDQYLVKLLDSIDYPIDNIYIQIGNIDRSITDQIVEEVAVKRRQSPNLNIHVHTVTYNPGSARGFNFGIQKLVNSSSASQGVPWGLVVNNDIAFYPGVLRYLSYQVYKRLDTDPRFGIGFFNLCCGGEWSAIVFTRRMVEKVGLFDENFYPAYYEDDDYGIRIYLASFQAARFLKANVSHGGVDGSRKYISGVESTLIAKKKEKLVLTQSQIFWKKCFKQGVEFSRAYISAKWNIRLSATTIQPICKSFRGINRLCKVGFTHPFNDTTKDIRYWKLDEEKFEYLKGIGNGSILINKWN